MIQNHTHRRSQSRSNYVHTPHSKRLVALIFFGTSCGLLGTTGISCENPTHAVSTAFSGDLGNGDSVEPALGGAHFVAFASIATNLCNDGRGCRFGPNEDQIFHGTTNDQQIFVKDFITDEVRIASINANGELGNSLSARPSISVDGDIVVFDSVATNLASCEEPPCTPNFREVYAHDFRTGETYLVSTRFDGSPGNGDSTNPDISGNGQVVVFESTASNLANCAIQPVACIDTNGTTDIYRRRLSSNEVIRVSVPDQTRMPSESDGESFFPSVDYKGHRVSFTTKATNLFEDDNQRGDVYVRDITVKTTRRMSERIDGTNPTNFDANRSAISSDGAWVAFESAQRLGIATNSGFQIFLRKREDRTDLTWVSEPVNNIGGIFSAANVSISDNASWVAFDSNHPGLTDDDDDDLFSRDVFAWNRFDQTIRRASNDIHPDGTKGNGESQDPIVRGDGTVYYQSAADNLLGDCNETPCDSNQARDIFSSKMR